MHDCHSSSPWRPYRIRYPRHPPETRTRTPVLRSHLLRRGQEEPVGDRQHGTCRGTERAQRRIHPFFHQHDKAHQRGGRHARGKTPTSRKKSKVKLTDQEINDLREGKKVFIEGMISNNGKGVRRPHPGQRRTQRHRIHLRERQALQPPVIGRRGTYQAAD